MTEQRNLDEQFERTAAYRRGYAAAERLAHAAIRELSHDLNELHEQRRRQLDTLRNSLVQMLDRAIEQHQVNGTIAGELDLAAIRRIVIDSINSAMTQELSQWRPTKSR